MIGPASRATDRRAITRPILVFDGDCGFCTMTAQWVAARLDSADVEPWQSLDLDALGLTEQQVSTAAYWVEPGRPPQRGHDAVAAALQAMGWPWRGLGEAITRPPLSWLAAPTYEVVAANRGRLPGSTPACRLDPPPES